MLRRNHDPAGNGQSTYVDLVSLVFNYCAFFLVSVAVILIFAAICKDGADIGYGLIKDISRGDIINLASQH